MGMYFSRHRLILESLFLMVLAGIYVSLQLDIFYAETRALINEALHYLPDEQISNRLTNFDTGMNGRFPIIAGAIFLIAAWMIFHIGAYPRLAAQYWDWRTILLLALALLLVAGALEIHHSFREYIRLSKDPDLNVTGIKVYSLYRKRTLLTDGIGILILFGLLELTSGFCEWFRERLCREKGLFYRIIAYLPLLAAATGLVYIAIGWQWPTPLWSGDTRSFLHWGGLFVLTWIMQAFILQEYLPEMKRTGGRALPTLVSGFLCLLIIGTFLIWGGYTGFNFRKTQVYFTDLGIILPLTLAIAALRRTFFNSRAELERQASDISAKLTQLREQLNPHFLFNALNSLYTAALRENSEKTADGIQRLGDMMRFMLNENNQERISLEKELEYLHNYLHIQRIRIDESQGVDIRVQIQEPDEPAYIAPMMLIPFVENAFKHGISHLSPSWIFIELTLNGGRLVFNVQNSLHTKQYDQEKARSGIGMENMHRRLELIYPGRYTLDIQKTQSAYQVTLSLLLW